VKLSDAYGNDVLRNAGGIRLSTDPEHTVLARARITAHAASTSECGQNGCVGPHGEAYAPVSEALQFYVQSVQPHPRSGSAADTLADRADIGMMMSMPSRSANTFTPLFHSKGVWHPTRPTQPPVLRKVALVMTMASPRTTGSRGRERGLY
jgi:hypothetical protein